MNESKLPPKGSVNVTTIPVGTFFTGRINDVSEIYVMAWGKVIVSLNDPHRTWSVPEENSSFTLYVKDYQPVTPSFKVDKNALTEIPIEKLPEEEEETEDCPF